MQTADSHSGLRWTNLLATGDVASTGSHEQDVRYEIQWQSRSEANHFGLAMEQFRESDAWISLLRQALFSLQGIESMHLARDDNTIDVWVVIPKRDIGLVRKIAETEREFMAQFVNPRCDPLFYFDFHTVYRESHDVSELVPRRAIEIPPA